MIKKLQKERKKNEFYILLLIDFNINLLFNIFYYNIHMNIKIL